jgi:hypothetical protein
MTTTRPNSVPAFALAYGRPLVGFLPVEIAIAYPCAPAWAVATVGGE